MVQIWDITQQTLKNTYQLHPGLIGPTTLSPNGRWVASVDAGGTIVLGDIMTGSFQRAFIPNDCPSSIAFLSKDTEIASITRDEGVVEVWNIVTGSLQCSYEGNTGSILSIGILSDRRRAAMTAFETIRLRDMENDDILQTISGHNDHIHGIQLSSDGQQVVSASEDNTLRIWNADSTHFHPTASRPIADIEYLVLSPDSQIVVSAWSDGQIRLCSMQTGSLLHTIRNINARSTMEFSSNGKYLTILEADDYIRI
ncbi:WD40 repeat domain-containing protein [Aspergillus affinis]|uniref:WD40 repeat domain-containing protein n=1 Tax=Aspergillus affinis TaxID=1070780 RepID=UPI0022FE1360|nr:WD40 repeat-like protein [Aspergillus affinis]KAI9036233.1 WD40 repeat-like protein [Aspergillus affinis]